MALAESEKELGLNITDEQIKDMKEHIYDIDFEIAKKREKEVRHDVMAHVYTFGMQAKSAMPIIHLGATSAYVGDNTDLIQIKEGLALLRKEIVNVILVFQNLLWNIKECRLLGFTHFQAAQLTTVGKRAHFGFKAFYLI